MQPRLTRSRTDVVLSGVCGGLAEYFHIDPVIVRLIFVLVTITSGIGIVVYPVLWLVTPKAPEPDPSETLGKAQDQPWGQQSLPGEAGAEAWRPHEVRLREPAVRGSQRPAPPAYVDQPPPPEAYRFDPVTGEQIRPDEPATGATVDLSRVQPGLSQPQQPSPAAPQRRGLVNWPGVILVGIGVILLANQLGIDADVVVPVIMVALGVLLLFRR